MSTETRQIPRHTRRNWTGWILEIEPADLPTFSAMPEADRESLLLLHTPSGVRVEATFHPGQTLARRSDWTRAYVASCPDLSIAMARRAATGESCGCPWTDCIGDGFRNDILRLLGPEALG